MPKRHGMLVQPADAKVAKTEIRTVEAGTKCGKCKTRARANVNGKPLCIEHIQSDHGISVN